LVSVRPQQRFTPGKRTPGTCWIGGWVGLKAGLDTKATEKILCNSNIIIIINSNIEIQRMWNMKCFVIPVIIEATGTVSKSLKNISKQYQDNTQ
jgi:hypothetical protein